MKAIDEIEILIPVETCTIFWRFKFDFTYLEFYEHMALANIRVFPAPNYESNKSVRFVIHHFIQ